MSLRTRLVAALVIISTVGLVAFGLVTSSLYRASLLDQLDAQLTAAARPQADRLTQVVFTEGASDVCVTTDNAPGSQPGRPQPGGPGQLQSLDADARLFVGGRQIACLPAAGSDATPAIPSDLATTSTPRHATVGAATGGGSWRVFALPLTDAGVAQDPGSGAGSARTVVTVARSTAAVDESLHRLVRIELATGAGLLVVLVAGAFIVLRRGLRPLERMATSASTITAGDLSVRVSPADTTSEIGQLGTAINSMLGGLETAFADRAATEARLRQFLADAAHELRTPITSIQGFAELFRLGDETRTPDLGVIMARIEAESARMHRLIEDLMLLARLDRTREMVTEVVDLSIVAADACTDAAAHAPGRQITLDAPTPVTVDGDADHLHQAVANLVANALHHTPEGTPVEVATSGVDGIATVTVRDHGPGLDAEGLAHAFDRFWQADAGRVGAGSGLGLSIVAGIAAEHGGRVEVANVDAATEVGGAVFTLTLPMDS